MTRTVTLIAVLSTLIVSACGPQTPEQRAAFQSDLMMLSTMQAQQAPRPVGFTSMCHAQNYGYLTQVSCQ